MMMSSAGNVAVHRHMVFSKVAVDEGAVAPSVTLLVERGADPPDDAADQLRAGGLAVEDAAEGEGAAVAPDARLACIGVDADLDEMAP